MNSLVMYSAVITSFFTGVIPEEEIKEKIQEQKEKLTVEEEKLVDDNSMECFLEFLIEFFN